MGDIHTCRVEINLKKEYRRWIHTRKGDGDTPERDTFDEGL